MKLKENGGIFSEKIINIFNNTLSLFCIADNIYYHQLMNITINDLNDYYVFINKITNEFKITSLSENDNIAIKQNLHNLKLGIIKELPIPLFLLMQNVLLFLL